LWKKGLGSCGQCFQCFSLTIKRPVDVTDWYPFVLVSSTPQGPGKCLMSFTPHWPTLIQWPTKQQTISGLTIYSKPFVYRSVIFKSSSNCRDVILVPLCLKKSVNNDVQHKYVKIMFQQRCFNKYVLLGLFWKGCSFFCQNSLSPKPKFDVHNYGNNANFVHQPIAADLFCTKQSC